MPKQHQKTEEAKIGKTSHTGSCNETGAVPRAAQCVFTANQPEQAPLAGTKHRDIGLYYEA